MKFHQRLGLVVLLIGIMGRIIESGSDALIMFLFAVGLFLFLVDWKR